MTNAVTVVAPEEHVVRVQRLGSSAVWIEVATVEDLAQAPADRPIVVLGDPEAQAAEHVTYVVRASIADDQLQALITAVATGSALAPPPSPSRPSSPEEARRAQAAFAASRTLAAATDLASTEVIATGAIIELLDLDRAHCLFYDAESGSLWSQARQRTAGDERRAVAGMVGWSARTGLGCAARVAGDDPRFALAYDDADGDSADQILVQPILGADARVHAVLVAIRRARSAPLGAAEAQTLARFAALAAPLLDQLSSHVEGQHLLDDGDPGEGMFRDEAIAAAVGGQWGDIVRVAPRWLSGAYWLLVVLIAGSVAFLALGRIATYSTGPAVIRSTARTSLAARSAGNVSAVLANAGDRVEPGTAIAQLDDVDQHAAVDRVSREFETQLRNHMIDPSDPAADSALRALRQQLEQARNALDERTLRATTLGVVSDLRVRPGQHLEPGDVVASIVDGRGGLEVVALLPGEDRPQLSPGMALRLEISGYQFAYQALEIESMSSDVIAPSEARRVLGAEVADSLHLTGQIVLVRGRINTPDFEADGRVFQYHDGMLGTAEVRIREERIVFALVPGLRRWGQ